MLNVGCSSSGHLVWLNSVQISSGCIAATWLNYCENRTRLIRGFLHAAVPCLPFVVAESQSHGSDEKTNASPWFVEYQPVF